MNDKQMTKLESKIVDLIDTNKPRPDMFEAIELLGNIKSAFKKYLDDVLLSSSKSRTTTNTGDAKNG
jgi:hypothetical protein